MKNHRLTALLMTAVLLLPLCMAGCQSGGNDGGEATKLSFKSASTYSYLKTLDGKQVTISGYMATSSPVDGSFLFLMNLPYQSCPFCKPNTSQLSNTMEVYPKTGSSFSYTTQAIKVVGKLEVAPSEKESFTDIYGYEFNYRIVDATYTVISSDNASGDIANWQKISDSGIVGEIAGNMYNFVNFLCDWNNYFVNSYTDADGNAVKGYYLYAADAVNYVTKEGAQYNYGYKDGSVGAYFDDIVTNIKKIDATAFEGLVKNVEKAKALAEKAFGELQSGNYTSEMKYLEKFDTNDYYFTLTKGEELKSELDALYGEFSDWLTAWEL